MQGDQPLEGVKSGLPQPCDGLKCQLASLPLRQPFPGWSDRGIGRLALVARPLDSPISGDMLRPHALYKHMSTGGWRNASIDEPIPGHSLPANRLRIMHLGIVDAECVGLHLGSGT